MSIVSLVVVLLGMAFAKRRRLIKEIKDYILEKQDKDNIFVIKDNDLGKLYYLSHGKIYKALKEINAYFRFENNISELNITRRLLREMHFFSFLYSNL